MTDFRTSTQISALATLLDVEESVLAELGRHGAEFVRDLRLAISDHLFADQAHLFARVSKLAPIVPNVVVAKVVTAVVPHLVAGRAAGALAIDHPARIEDLLNRMPAEYLAASAPYLDPRAVAEVAPKIKGDMLVPAARILLANEDYVTAAGFVEFATERLIADLIAGIENDYGLVMTGALVFSDTVLEMVVRAIPPSRYGPMFKRALSDDVAVASAISIFARVSDDLRLVLIEAVAPELDRSDESIVHDLIARSADDVVTVNAANQLLAGARAVRKDARGEADDGPVG